MSDGAQHSARRAPTCPLHTAQLCAVTDRYEKDAFTKGTLLWLQESHLPPHRGILPQLCARICYLGYRLHSNPTTSTHQHRTSTRNARGRQFGTLSAHQSTPRGTSHTNTSKDRGVARRCSSVQAHAYGSIVYKDATSHVCACCCRRATLTVQASHLECASHRQYPGLFRRSWSTARCRGPGRCTPTSTGPVDRPQPVVWCRC